MNHNTDVTGRPLLLTVKAAAKHLGVSASMIRTLIERGTLPKVKLTPGLKGQVYTPLAAVEALATPDHATHGTERHADNAAERDVDGGTEACTLGPILELRAEWATLTSKGGQ